MKKLALAAVFLAVLAPSSVVARAKHRGIPGPGGCLRLQAVDARNPRVAVAGYFRLDDEEAVRVEGEVVRRGSGAPSRAVLRRRRAPRDQRRGRRLGRDGGTHVRLPLEQRARRGDAMSALVSRRRVSRR